MTYSRDFLVLALLAIVQPYPQASAAATNCAAIDNDIARLQCYDERERSISDDTSELIVPAASNEVGITQSPSSLQTPAITALSEVAEAVPELDLPLEVIVETDPDPQVLERIIYVEKPQTPAAPDEIRSAIVEITNTISRRKQFRLENGQIWRETKEYGLRFSIGSEVYLKKGLMSGYNMTSGRNTVRVARVQ